MHAKTDQHGERNPATEFHTTDSRRGLPQAPPLTLSKPHQVVQRQTLVHAKSPNRELRTRESSKPYQHGRAVLKMGRKTCPTLESRERIRQSFSPKSFQVAFECRSLLEKLMTRDSRACFSYRRTTVELFHTSGVDSAVFAGASVPEGIWSDLQLLTTELFQLVFHILVCVRAIEGEEELSFASSCLEHP